MTRPLDIATLAAAYAAGTTTPEQVLGDIFAQIARDGERPVWISLAPRERVADQLARNQGRRDAGEALPLFGIPFAVKDNIDVAGLPTTAGCPDFAYVPARSATAVEKLEAAGAIVVGKTNLDQFATGLVGTRSPYGICRSVFDPAYISGGSSSGSAVAVAAGLVSFALGTDTAGSGRVPAGFNNIVGLKPTKGLISARGVVPACRSQDCVSIFAGTTGDTLRVLEVAQGFDAEDCYSRPVPERMPGPLAGFRFGVPDQPLEFFGDAAAATLYAAAIERLEAIGGTAVEVDFSPYREAARLLYQGPWVAERLAALKAYGFERADAIDPIVWSIIGGAHRLSAVEGFTAFYRLAELIRAAEPQWRQMDVLLLPTTGTTYRIDQVLADPIALNSNLGLYTNFVNLMDLSAVAVPAGFRPNGLPFGVTLIGRAFEDERVARLADRLHRTIEAPTIGATGLPLPIDLPAAPAPPTTVKLAVVGAHLSGQPLNGQLASRQARLVGTARTASGYSLYALDGTVPAKPGLIRDGIGRGSIEIEVWELDPAGFGSFVAEIPPPLGIGTITLADGSLVKGFLCEAHAIGTATDITAFGGWRNWLAKTPRAGA
jgi:allophanate hydrolase